MHGLLKELFRRDKQGVTHAVGGTIEGGLPWHSSIDEVIGWIRQGVNFYVNGKAQDVGSTKVTILVVENPSGNYLRTSPDGEVIENLDELP